MKNKNKRILFLLYRSPFSSNRTNDRRQFLIYSVLKEYYDSKILTFGNSLSVTNEQVVVQLFPSKIKKILNFLFRLKSPRLTHYYSKDYKSIFSNILKSFKPDIIYVEHILMMQYLLKLNITAKIVFYNDESNLYVNKKNVRGNYYQRIRNIGLSNLEVKALKKSNIALCITEEECHFLRSKGFDNIFNIQYGVDLSKFPFDWSSPVQHSILFLGDFSHYPNRDALQILANKIFPKTVKYQSKLKVVGRNTDRIKKYYVQGMEIYDNVDDVRNYYKNATVFVAPIFVGAGLRVKILEAALCGIPLIITPLANLGINLIHGKEAFICGTTSEIITTLIRFLNGEFRNEIDRMRVSAREKVIEKFNEETVKQKLISLYNNYLN
jgi:glycosyltransferase involved in cell wall biosynthesis